MKSVGTLKRDHTEWVIGTTPDVLMRLKRIFPRSNQNRLGEIRLRITDEVSFELKWVMERFPFDLEPAVERDLKKYARAHASRVTRLQQIQLDVLLPAVGTMALPPRDYQIYASALYLENGSLLLADEMGIGKTVSGITSFTDPRTLPACVVVQSTLPVQWKREVNRFLPNARVHIIKQKAAYDLPPSDVYIITYSMLASWVETLGIFIKSIIFDEVQELRHNSTGKFEAAKLLAHKARFRLGLSATPIYNYGGEIWNVYSILAPDALGSKAEFDREFCDSIGGKQIVREPEALGQYLRNNFLMLRRTRSDVKRFLPPASVYVLEAEIDQHLYNNGLTAAEELANTILTSTDFHEAGRASLEFNTRLRMATGVAKAAFVAGLVRMLVDSGEKVLLAGWHRDVHDIWAKLLGDLKIVFFTGHESAKQKQNSINSFLEKDAEVFIISNRSGAGLDGLQHVCSTVVLGELDWSPKVIDQIKGRIFRDGQEKPVNVYIPVCNAGSDPGMAEALGVKRAQSAGIVELGEGDESGLTSIDPERIKKLAVEFLRSRNRPIPIKPVKTEPGVEQTRFQLTA